MSNNNFSARTVVTVTVEVETGHYGPEWKIEDIRKQAAQEGINSVQNALVRDPLKSGQRMLVKSSAAVRVIIEGVTP